MAELDLKTAVLYALAVLLSISWFRRRREKSTIPAFIGGNGPISSYLAAIHFFRHPSDVIQQGYSHYPSGVFRVPTLFEWYYVASGPQRTAEIAAAPDHLLSALEALSDLLSLDYTQGPEISANPYHVPVILGGVTRNLGRCFPEVRDEIVCSFKDVVVLDDKEWTLLHVLPSIMQIVARTSNRLFVGLPLCREQEFLDMALKHSVDTFMRGQIIGLLPGFLKPILGPFIATRKSSLRHALKFLGPIVNERLKNEQEHGRNWPERPNDLISWLLERAEGEERTAPAITARILMMNQAAIHTTTMTLTGALYDLTAYPEHILPMREEVERIVAKEGWSKTSVSKMYKIDSFIRESQRLTIGPVALARKVVAQDGFTFSDGTRIPYGAMLTVTGGPAHSDAAIYDHPETFDGFRFSRMRDQQTNAADDGEGVFNRQMVSTGHDHLVFGHGKHSCPGRFFAATEIKAMLAHILVNYDVKAETAGVRPVDEWFGLLRFPSRQGKIFIRKRA
ncbi:cytochrome P450 [Mycena maculata]|uniref:Cytochrome P450 n=1 Tax=Mycena maculata TaxID=230809 RepID=A0AAD7NM01_9AGAR|nr:cytochrome P450 [Mycena maculata]